MLFALFFVAATEPPAAAAPIAEPTMLIINTTEELQRFLEGTQPASCYNGAIVNVGSLSAGQCAFTFFSRVFTCLASEGKLKINGKTSELGGVRRQLEVVGFETNNFGGTDSQQPIDTSLSFLEVYKPNTSKGIVVG